MHEQPWAWKTCVAHRRSLKARARTCLAQLARVCMCSGHVPRVLHLFWPDRPDKRLFDINQRGPQAMYCVPVLQLPGEVPLHSRLGARCFTILRHDRRAGTSRLYQQPRYRACRLCCRKFSAAASRDRVRHRQPLTAKVLGAEHGICRAAAESHG